MKSVAVLGASGFVGEAVSAALRARGLDVVEASAPRLRTAARSLDDLRSQTRSPQVQAEIARLRRTLGDCGAVVNAAGIADAAGSGDDLFGANALLPAVVALAASGHARLVHVSSAAVQGRRALDETGTVAPFSPYSTAKTWGERLVLGYRPEAVCFRPTSVQGSDRRVTAALVRLASSPLSSVAGRGEHPTPQVLVENVGDAIAFVATTPERPPRFVLQPAEEMTVAGLMRVLGDREPRHVPEPVARLVVDAASRVGRRQEQVAPIARRLEMLWFGQAQAGGWLRGRWEPPKGSREWGELRELTLQRVLASRGEDPEWVALLGGLASGEAGKGPCRGRPTHAREDDQGAGVAQAARRLRRGRLGTWPRRGARSVR